MSQHAVSVLLVDDEPRNLDALEAILAGPDYDLLRAEDADRALRLLLENDDVAAIILDVQMPRVNGIELARIIKGTRRFRAIPILFLTAHFMDDQDIVNGYGAGAVDYLTKPFNPQILKHKIGVFADLFRKTRALAELNATLDERVKARTAELEKSEAALMRAASQKDEFLAVLAHELRNPLAPLRTGLDILMQLPAPTPAAGRTMAAMNRQLDHIVRLIDDLLDVSRISRGVLELKKESAQLAAIVEGSVETFHAIFDQKGVGITVETAPSLYGVVDATRIAQIIGNLLHNAAKYTPSGGAVVVTMKESNGLASISVSDNGGGIAASQIEHVFEMFSSIESADKSANRGAGIGLALAKRLAQMHGGDLVASSVGEGHGATFTLTVPCVVEPRVQEVVDKEESGGQRLAKEALVVLVIEDNEDVADTLALWLESLGHEVKVARTGPSGLEMALSTAPDVVLCDVGLPEMDGVEVCHRVRKSAQVSQPLMVALTGWGKDEDRKRTREAGFDHHLVKPVVLDKLNDVLNGVRPKAKRAIPA